MPGDTPAQFQEDKPFRLSLYVRPENLAVITTPKVNLDNSNVITPKANKNNKENKRPKHLRRNGKENKKSTEVAAGKVKNEKLKERNIILFDEENIPPVRKKHTTKQSTKTDQIKKPLTEKDEKSKNTNKGSSVLNESQDENPKEDDEFEKWAHSINSEFEDIDKFELSITYSD